MVSSHENMKARLKAGWNSAQWFGIVALMTHWSCPLLRCYAQEKLPAFDVVSVKKDAAADTGELVQLKKKVIRPAYHPFRYTPGRLTCSLPLITIIREAYAVEFWQISGPKWLYDGVYDIEAKMPPDTAKETARLMLRTMLAERFGLKFHWENRSLPVYLLEAGKKGTQLTEATDAGKVRKNLDQGHLSGILSMDAFVTLLYDRSDLPVVDRTGLKGVYNIELRWNPEIADGPRGQGQGFKSLLRHRAATGP